MDIIPYSRATKVPVEILEEIFKYLTKNEVVTCLSVNKWWNKAAQMFFETEIRIVLHTAARSLLEDLIIFPLFATKITKLTFKTSNKGVSYYWIYILLRCPNVITLEFEDCEPHFLLNQIKSSAVIVTKLPNIQEIKINARQQHNYDIAGNILPSRIWRHRDTINHPTLFYKSTILAYRHSSINLIELLASVFPGLQQLEYTNDINAVVDLHQLLLKSTNIRSLYLDNVDVFFDTSEDTSLLQQRTKLRRLCLCSDYVHFNALRFLMNILDKLHYIEIDSSIIVTDAGQDMKEIDYVLKHFPILLTDILYITSDKKNYSLYRDFN